MAGEGEFPKADGDVLYDGDVNLLYNLIESTIQVAIAADNSNDCYRHMIADNFLDCDGSQNTVCYACTTSCYDSTNCVYCNIVDDGTITICTLCSPPSGCGSATTTCIYSQCGYNAAVCYDSTCECICLDNYYHLHFCIFQQTYASSGTSLARTIIGPLTILTTSGVDCCTTTCVDLCRVGADTYDMCCNGNCVCQIGQADFSLVECTITCVASSSSRNCVYICRYCSTDTCIWSQCQEFDTCPKNILLTTNSTIPTNQCIRYDVYDVASSTILGCDLIPGEVQSLTQCSECIRLNIKQCSSCGTNHGTSMASYGYSVS